jgi:UDP-2-acetamido-3-amino-2,3-dideoxy-glucuronate N-acetyltransferase
VSIRIHPTADVSEKAIIGEGTSIWHQAQVREGVHIGDNVKIQNYVSVYHGVTLEDGVFVGPHVCFTNDMNPRAINPDGSLKAADDWVLTRTLVKRGAALGANSTIRCGVTIGEWALVGSGSVVTRDVPDYGLVYGNPARVHGFVCTCARPVQKVSLEGKMVIAKCDHCERTIEIPLSDWERVE